MRKKRDCWGLVHRFTSLRCVSEPAVMLRHSWRTALQLKTRSTSVLWWGFFSLTQTPDSDLQDLTRVVRSSHSVQRRLLAGAVERVSLTYHVHGEIEVSSLFFIGCFIAAFEHHRNCLFLWPSFSESKLSLVKWTFDRLKHPNHLASTGTEPLLSTVFQEHFLD